ncbi:MAG: hypothetical protein U0163_10655 [Gemmatimonadaceae bacterium]
MKGARDEGQAKLGVAVGALETIRLNLLRLHAEHSVTVSGLTAPRVRGASVRRHPTVDPAAHDEVEHALKAPA